VIRATSAIAAIAIGLAACTTPAQVEPLPTPSVDPFEVRVRGLQRDVAAVVALQVAAMPLLDPALTSIRAVDAVLPRLLDDATLDDALSRLSEVVDAVAGIDLDPARPATREVAAAVDAARLSLATTLEVITHGGDRAYLDAEDAVLVAVRAHAEATDALAQVLELHLPTYVSALDLLTDFASRRSRFRSASEAADALAVELEQVLGQIALAQQDVGQYVAARADSVRAVNTAQDAATAAWESRAPGGSEPPGEQRPGDQLPGEDVSGQEGE